MRSYKELISEINEGYNVIASNLVKHFQKEFNKAFDILKKNNFTINIETWDNGNDVISVTCLRTDYSSKKRVSF